MKLSKPKFCEWTIFATAIGFCGLVWRENRISTFLLPEQDTSKLKKRLIGLTNRSESAESLPPWIEKTITKVSRHLEGEKEDFSDLSLEVDHLSEFRRSVYRAARKIPPGEIRTYGQLADAIGNPRASRAVGMALGANPIALIIPCHRIIGGNQKLGGFSAFGGCETKKKLLALEGYQSASL